MNAASTACPTCLGSLQPAPGQSATDAEKSGYRQVLRLTAVAGFASALTFNGAAYEGRITAVNPYEDEQAAKRIAPRVERFSSESRRL